MSLSRARLEGDVVALIKHWAETHPQELVGIDIVTKAARAGLLGSPTQERQRGFTAQRTLLHKAEIPYSLYVMMQSKFSRTWTRDRWLLNVFLSHFQVGCVNRTSKLKV